MDELTRLTMAHHATYLFVSVLVTVWVGHTLHRHGRIFLVDKWDGTIRVLTGGGSTSLSLPADRRSLSPAGRSQSRGGSFTPVGGGS